MCHGRETASNQSVFARQLLLRRVLGGLFEILLAQVAAITSTLVIRAQLHAAQSEDRQHLSHPGSVKAPEPRFFCGKCVFSAEAWICKQHMLARAGGR